MDMTHKQEYRIRELETRSVTLFPGRAQVHRQIKDVPLKAGENQITIVGLTPTVDQDSIKVEGTGSAIITDMAVELLPNREIFEDVYPEYDNDGDSSDSDPDSASDGEGEEERANAVMGDIRERLRLAEDDEKRASEILAGARRRLEILDSYGKLMTTDRQNTAAPDVKIDEGLATYRAEREKIFADIWDGNVQHREIKDKLQRLRKEEGRIAKQYRRETAKADKVKRKEARAKQKEQQKAARKQQEVRKEQARVRKERESFWPKKVYSIRVTLDATAFTPGSSRRNSIASDVEVVSSPKSPEKSSDHEFSGSTCDLSISYVTTDAYWSPAYDMALSTTANTGHVCFDAQLTNQTAETWSNCKITLSTPQADFSGLHDTIPTLVPWRVRLTGGRAAHGDAYSLRNDIMFSRDEQSHRAAWADKQTGRTHAQQPRAELFGVVKSRAKSSRGAVVEPLMVGADEAKEEECEESDEEMGFGLFDGDDEPPRRSVNDGMTQHSLGGGAPPPFPRGGPPPPPPPPGGSFRPTMESASRGCFERFPSSQGEEEREHLASRQLH
ncbi:mucoidy inhibitor A [Apiospora hydei]|uniref:Mucoidy inhibitor A n=1 Tax=Apiospora hydei TaxID=1337664 RepID=A0ABR1WEW8_9PEZI